MKTILLTLILVASVGCQAPKEKKGEQSMGEIVKGMAKVEAYVPDEIKNLDTDLEKAQRLLEWIHWEVPLQNTSPGEWQLPIELVIQRAFEDPNQGHICGGLALLYGALASSIGLKVRVVSLFDTIPNLSSSHSTTETLIDGRWVATDPSFNVMLKSNDGSKFIGYIEAAESGFTVAQFAAMDNRRIDEYYLPLEELLNFVFVNADPYDSNGYEVVPSNWDGSFNSPYGFVANIKNQGYNFWQAYFTYREVR